MPVFWSAHCQYRWKFYLCFVKLGIFQFWIIFKKIALFLGGICVMLKDWLLTMELGKLKDILFLNVALTFINLTFCCCQKVYTYDVSKLEQESNFTKILLTYFYFVFVKKN